MPGEQQKAFDGKVFAARLPTTPGVYLMKDEAGRVIYVGKAKDLRSRAGSYFLKAAAEEPRTARLVDEIRDIDYVEALTPPPTSSWLRLVSSPLMITSTSLPSIEGITSGLFGSSSRVK